MYRLSRLSIVACVAGMVLLLTLSVYSGRQMLDKQDAIDELLQLHERINEFSAASDNLVLFGADPGLWRAYRAEGMAIQQELEQLGEGHSEARKAAQRLGQLIHSVDMALGAIDTGSDPTQIDRDVQALDVPVRSRIVMHHVAGQGIALDTALDSALSQRQDVIAREAAWIGATLAGAALIFGALCVIAFGLIHRRVAQPVRSLSNTLERLREGETDARAPVTSNDELGRLAEMLNKALDERDAADTQLLERQKTLQAALDKLADTRDRLIRAQSIASIGSWDLHLATGQLEWSDEVFEISGLRREDFDGTLESFFGGVHPEDQGWLRRSLAAWVEKGGEFDAEHRIVRPDGEVRWVREQARIIPDQDGRMALTTGTVQDITAQRQMDERLRQFQQLLEGTEDLCAIVDDNYRYLWINQAYADRYGVSPQAIRNRPIVDVLGQRLFEGSLRPRLDRVLAGESLRYEAIRDFPGIGKRNMLARWYPIDVPGQSSRRVGAVITDVTEIRQAEADLEKQGRLLDMAGRAARFGAWSVDLETHVVAWSDMVAEIHGMPHGFSPSLEEGIRFYAPEFRERVSELFKACAERGEPYDEELQIIDANGERRWVRAVGEPDYDENQNIIRVQGAFQDISERKALEHESRNLTDRLAAMLEAITDGFVAVDEQWRYTYVNATAAWILGKSREELIGTSIWDQFPELVGSRMERALVTAMEERISNSAEEFFEPLDIWFDMHAYPWEEGVAVFFRDVTEHHQMLEQLRAQEAALRVSRDELNSALNTRQILINSLPAHIAMLDADGVIIDVNDQWRHFGENNQFDNGSDFGIGTNYIGLCEAARGECSEEAATVADGLRDVLVGKRETFALEYPCHSPDQKRWFRVMFSRLSSEGAAAGGAVAMHIDVTERKLAERELSRLAYQDPLTGLLSRNGFAQRLGKRFNQSAWPAGAVVAMLDVVKQHDINEAHGYTTGDRILVELGRRLKRQAGRRGLVARIGGDEFVVYLPRSTKMDLETQLGSLIKAVNQPFHPDDSDSGIDIDVGLRMGYTVLGDEQRRPEDLVHEAELALYENREASTAREPWVAFTPELNKQTRERIQLTSELRRALEADEFELHFQPKVNLADGRMISAEALIRWQHPEHGLLPPGLFIPVAEQSQLIGPIGDWVLRAACRQLREWQTSDLAAVGLAVNVSQVQFMLGDFPEKVHAALQEFGVDPSHLTLEITESVFERQSERLLTEIRELKELGVRMSLDDFGTGYSSLLYLQRYPFDEIKIDRGFVHHVLDDRYSHNVVRTVMNLAAALDAEPVAEGVESRQVADALLEMGCQVGQGYYFSMPLAAEDFRWLLQRGGNLPLSSNSRAH
nr:EAL domain-containing protein [Wenzhouxiangella sp. XN201]